MAGFAKAIAEERVRCLGVSLSRKMIGLGSRHDNLSRDCPQSFQVLNFQLTLCTSRQACTPVLKSAHLKRSADFLFLHRQIQSRSACSFREVACISEPFF
jgi:hypothetical protein